MSEKQKINYAPSITISEKNNKLCLISFPPVANDNMTTTDRIIHAVFRSTNYSSKRCDYCELDGNYYTEDDNNLGIRYLDGAQQICRHHCYGCIQYHTSNEKLFDQANMYFECEKSIINKQSFAGKQIKIQRSSGKIVDGCITKDSCLRIINDYLMMYVEFIVNDEIYYKYVRLLDYNHGDKLTKGLLTLNPELKNEQLVLTIKNHPEWLNEYREPWKKLFEKELNKINIHYKFKYED